MPAVAAQVVVGDPVSAVEEEVPFLPPLPAHSRHRVPPFFLYGFGMILADFFRLQALWERWMDGGSSDGLFLFLQGFGAFFALFFTHAKKRRPAGRPSVSKKPLCIVAKWLFVVGESRNMVKVATCGGRVS